jgi:glycosyltransferase involved in cell wall biosynthesis
VKRADCLFTKYQFDFLRALALFPLTRISFNESQGAPRFSIVVAVRDGKGAKQAAAHGAMIHGPIPYELLIVEGSNPSLQRNVGAESARGEILVFWDDDSQPGSDYLEKLWERWSKSDTGIVVGGPALPISDGSSRSEALVFFFSSVIGAGPFVGRYRKRTVSMDRSSRKLILCNLSLSRKKFLENGGFSPHLYPQEENEFLSRLGGDRGFTYDPEVCVQRLIEGDAIGFYQKIFRYGWGRGKRLARFPSIYSLGAVVFLSMFLPLLILKKEFAMGLLFVYFSAIFLSVLFRRSKPSKEDSNWANRIATSIWSLLFIPSGHFSYGCGALCGLLNESRAMLVGWMSIGRKFSKMNPRFFR